MEEGPRSRWHPTDGLMDFAHASDHVPIEIRLLSENDIRRVVRGEAVFERGSGTGNLKSLS